MFRNSRTVIICAIVLCISLCAAIPKFEDQRGSITNPYPDNQWRRSFKVNDTYAAASTAADRSERLGSYTTGYGSGLQGYPGSGVGVYSPLKIDIGGIVVGALIGIGALLIVPKLVNAFQGGYGGGNYRSIDSDPTGVADLMSRLDDILSQNNIDSTTCVQRAVCTYVRSSAYHMTLGNPDQADQIIHNLSGNAIVEYMLDGTAVKEALENGKNINGQDCDTIYPGCPLDKQTSMQVLSKLIPKNKSGEQIPRTNEA